MATFGFDEQSAQRISRVVRRVEATPRGEAGTPVPLSFPGLNLQIVNVDSEEVPENVAGECPPIYRATLVKWTLTGNCIGWDATDQPEVWVFDVNRGTLITDTRYAVLQIGRAELNGEDRPLFVTLGGTCSGNRQIVRLLVGIEEIAPGP